MNDDFTFVNMLCPVIIFGHVCQLIHKEMFDQEEWCLCDV